MDAKEVSVRCPCCDSRIVVDVRTAKVVAWSRATEVGPEGRPKVTAEDFDRLHERTLEKTSESRDRFDDALKREQSRARDLEDLWRKAGDSLRDEDDDAP